MDVVETIGGIVIAFFQIFRVETVEEGLDELAGPGVGPRLVIAGQHLVDRRPGGLGSRPHQFGELRAPGGIAAVARRAELLPEHRGGARPHAGQQAEEAVEGQPVLRVVRQAQQGDHVLDVGLFEDADARGDDEGDLGARQFQLQLDGMEVGAVEHGHLPQGTSPGALPLDQPDDGLRLLVPVVQEERHRLVAAVARGAQGLLELLRVAGDRGVGDRQDLGRAAVVALELDDPRGGVADGKLHDVAEIGPAPRVDALEVVADDHDVALAPGEGVDEARLQEVRVLVLVDEDVAELALVLLADVGVLLDQAQAVEQQVVEIHDPQFLLARRVAPVDAAEVRRVAGELVEPGIEDLLQRLAAVDGVAEEAGEHLLLRELLAAELQFLQAVVDQLAGVVAVGDDELVAEAEAGRVAAQQAVADMVEGAAPDLSHPVAGGMAGALEHLARGAVGEGQQQDRRGRQAALDEVGHAVDERLRLAGAGGRQHQQRAVARRGRRQLFRVEDARVVDHGTRSPTFPAKGPARRATGISRAWVQVRSACRA